tara:strand:+ start:37 stop:498 length:462 start_codon:yes stop_codon:yes gene_type:complete
MTKLILFSLFSFALSFSGDPKNNSISILPSGFLSSTYPYLGTGITLNYENNLDEYMSLKATISRLKFRKNISSTNFLFSVNSLIGYEYLFLDLGAGLGISVESNSTSPIINIQTALRYIIENFFINAGIGITKKINNDSEIGSLYFGIGVQFD